MNLAEFDEMLRAQPRRLTPVQVAALLKVTTRTLRLWRIQGLGPAHVRIGKKFIKYEEPVVLAWLEQQRRLNDHARCPTCGTRVFHDAQGEPEGGHDEAP